MWLAILSPLRDGNAASPVVVFDESILLVDPNRDDTPGIKS
jgi:hypothetical protein